MSTDAEQETEVNTEGTDVCSGLAGDPEYRKVPVYLQNDAKKMSKIGSDLSLSNSMSLD